MYINPFLAGVLCSIFVAFSLVTLAVIIAIIKRGRKK